MLAESPRLCPPNAAGLVAVLGGTRPLCIREGTRGRSDEHHDAGLGRLSNRGRGPETRFAETSGGRSAYQVVGDGPIDVLVTHSPVFPIDHVWDELSLVRFLDRLSSFSRHVWFDPRGRGASDPLPHVEERFAEAIADDVLALIDHLG